MMRMKETLRQSGKSSRRSAFTLLEVVIAVAVLLGSITALFQLMNHGHRASVQAQFRTQAVMLVDTKLNEAVAGVLTLQSTTDEESEDYPGWLWSMSVDDAGIEGLLQVTVTAHRDGDTTVSAHEYSATRFVRDPQIFLDAALGGGS
ncbi:MAG: hypothetical protein HUJ26_10715 [Planctomycetaceae bacterium]|nr:hypothetical protein [Planctomycetaceae bacterium]